MKIYIHKEIPKIACGYFIRHNDKLYLTSDTIFENPFDIEEDWKEFKK